MLNKEIEQDENCKQEIGPGYHLHVVYKQVETGLFISIAEENLTIITTVVSDQTFIPKYANTKVRIINIVFLNVFLQ